jgi:exonuclease SbcD
VLGDDHGDVHFCPIPYADPAAVRLHVDDDEVRDHDSATRRLAEAARVLLPKRARAVAIGHCWVTGGSPSESERPLTVGGTGEVGADCFDGFAYTALGHLHRPQEISDGIEYSGSILKYSFSEADHRKSVSIVELDADGTVDVERVDLTPRRDVRILEGSLHEIRQGPQEGESADDYLLVRLSDRKAILDVMGKLRDVYPNVLHVERPAMQEGTESGLRGREYLKRSELELFQAFHEEVTGEDLEQEAEAVLEGVVADVRKERKEAGD